MFHVQLNVGIGFIPQTPDRTTGFPGWRKIRAAFTARRRIVHQQARTGIAMKLKPTALIGFLLQCGGTLRHLLGCCLRLLLGSHQLLRFLFCVGGAFLRNLRAGFRGLKTLLQSSKTRFDTRHIRLGKNRGTPGQHAYHHGKSAFFIHFVASLKEVIESAKLLNRFRLMILNLPILDRQSFLLNRFSKCDRGDNSGRRQTARCGKNYSCG